MQIYYCFCSKIDWSKHLLTWASSAFVRGGHINPSTDNINHGEVLILAGWDRCFWYFHHSLSTICTVKSWNLVTEFMQAHNPSPVATLGKNQSNLSKFPPNWWGKLPNLATLSSLLPWRAEYLIKELHICTKDRISLCLYFYIYYGVAFVYFLIFYYFL